VIAGFSPTRVTFRGSFRFSDVLELEAALAQLQELVDSEDADMAPALVLRRRGCELRVIVETICARDEYLAYETLIEGLATFASAGEVTGEIDNTITTYAPLVEPSISSAKVAMMALPLLATLGDSGLVLA
jgi:hypothetical protein